MNNPGNVAELQRGQTARVSGILDNGTVNTFFEMGFVPDALVKCNFKAPLGGPVCVRVSDHDITLRRAEAALILIQGKTLTDAATSEDTASR